MTATEIIEKIDAEGDFVTGDDGYVFFWPTGVGGLSPWVLRVIADEIDRRNAPLDKSIKKYFKEHKCRA